MSVSDKDEAAPVGDFPTKCSMFQLVARRIKGGEIRARQQRAQLYKAMLFVCVFTSPKK